MTERVCHACQGEKMRTPSWTDRVLWRSSQPGLTQVAYTCGPQTLSDHRPVAATFLMKAHAYEIEEVSKLVDEGWRDLDLAVMAAMPKFAPPAALTTLPLSDCRTVADMSGLAARNQWRR